MVVIDTRKSSGKGESRLMGLLLVVGGGIWLLNEAGLAAVSTKTLLSVVLILLGLGMMVIRPGSNRGALAFGGIVISALLIFSPSATGSMQSGLGDFSERPTKASELAEGYSLVAGSLLVDLTDVDLPGHDHELNISVAFGEVRLVLPEEITVTVHAQGLAGEVLMDGETLDEGLGLRSLRFLGPGTEPDLKVNIEVAFGSIEVTHG